MITKTLRLSSNIIILILPFFTQESRMHWPPVGKGRGVSGRPGCRPGPAPGPRLAPMFIAEQHPAPGQANVPYGLHPGRQAMYDAPHSQRSMLPSGMPGEAP